MANLLFYLLAGGAIGFGAGVVTAKQPLFSVLNLLGSFFCLAGIYLLSGFQFLAATQLLVYAGAIMVLFLFVIMLLNLSEEAGVEPGSGSSLSGKRLGVAAAAAGGLALIGVFAPGAGEPYVAPAAVAADGIDHLPALATVLFSKYVLAFEAASLLLLATMIGVVALAKRNRPSDTDVRPVPTGLGALPRRPAGVDSAPPATGDVAPRPNAPELQETTP